MKTLAAGFGFGKTPVGIAGSSVAEESTSSPRKESFPLFKTNKIAPLLDSDKNVIEKLNAEDAHSSIIVKTSSMVNE